MTDDVLTPATPQAVGFATPLAVGFADLHLIAVGERRTAIGSEDRFEYSVPPRIVPTAAGGRNRACPEWAKATF